jgi:hypothetical protein
MVQSRFPSGRSAKRRTRNLFLTAALVATSLSPLVFFAGRSTQDAPFLPVADDTAGRAVRPDPVTVALVGTYDRALVDPTPALHPEALGISRNAPLAATLKPFAMLPTDLVEADAPSEKQEPSPTPQPSLAMKAVPPEPLVPLPTPRPAEFKTRRPAEAPQMAAAPTPRQSKNPAAPSVPEENPNFFERLFGIRRASPPPSARSYAALESPVIL